MPNGIDFRRFYILDFRSGANCLAPIFEWHPLPLSTDAQCMLNVC